METLSRVKRYEDLRKRIEDDSIGTETPPEEKLQSYAKRLNEIDPSIFKKVTITEEEPNTPQRERKVTSDYDDSDSTMQEFRNEYLDDFINEVREYNIKKGNRESENTQIDILNQLHAVSRAKRSDYIQNIEDEISEPKQEEMPALDREEIAAQVKSLLEEETVPKETEGKQQADFVKEVQPNDAGQETREASKALIQAAADTNTALMEESSSLDDQPKQDIDPQQGAYQKNNQSSAPAETTKQEKVNPFVSRKTKPTVVAAKEAQAEAEREKKLHQKLVEETQQLRVQLNEYEDDLNDLSEGVEKTNKLLNVILGCLILALLVIIGIIIYWVIQAGGLV